MTLANKITISRFFIIPIMVIFGILGMAGMPLDQNVFLNITVGQLIFVILFIIGSLTDFLDGYYARKRNEVTTFGKFLDPILDKLLVLAAFIFVPLFPFWKGDQIMEITIAVSIIIILLREFFITGFRLVAMSKNLVIAANKLGKIKTAFTMLNLIYLLLNGFGIRDFIAKKASWFKTDWIGFLLLMITVILTVASGIEYLYKNRHILKKSVRANKEEQSNESKNPQEENIELEEK